MLPSLFKKIVGSVRRFIRPSTDTANRPTANTGNRNYNIQRVKNGTVNRPSSSYVPPHRRSGHSSDRVMPFSDWVVDQKKQKEKRKQESIIAQEKAKASKLEKEKKIRATIAQERASMKKEKKRQEISKARMEKMKRETIIARTKAVKETKKQGNLKAFIQQKRREKKIQRDKNYKEYKDICRGVFEKSFDVEQPIHHMTIPQLRHLSSQAHIWIDKTKQCYTLREKFADMYYNGKSNIPHDLAIETVKAYNKQIVRFKEKIDTIIKQKERQQNKKVDMKKRKNMLVPYKILPNGTMVVSDKSLINKKDPSWSFMSI